LIGKIVVQKKNLIGKHFLTGKKIFDKESATFDREIFSKKKFDREISFFDREIANLIRKVSLLIREIFAKKKLIGKKNI